MYILLDFRTTWIFKVLYDQSAKFSSFTTLVVWIPWIVPGIVIGNITSNGRAWRGWWPMGHARSRAAGDSPSPRHHAPPWGGGLDRDGMEMEWDMDLQVGLAQQDLCQVRPAENWRPTRLQHCWGKGCPGPSVSPLPMYSWSICSWDEKLQKDISWFFIFIPRNQRRTLAQWKINLVDQEYRN